MKELIRILNKYIILLTVSSLFGMPWFYAESLIFSNFQKYYSYYNYIPTITQLSIKIAITVLVIIDCKKLNLSNIILISIATFCFPLLGILILSILLLEKQKLKA